MQIIILFSVIGAIPTNTAYGRLLDFLLSGYNAHMRPVYDSSKDTTVVTIKPQLNQFIELVMMPYRHI